VAITLSFQKKVSKPFFEQLHFFKNFVPGMANLNRSFYFPGNDHYFSEDWNGGLLADSF
jgi:hypothetical protein